MLTNVEHKEPKKFQKSSYFDNCNLKIINVI